MAFQHSVAFIAQQWTYRLVILSTAAQLTMKFFQAVLPLSLFLPPSSIANCNEAEVQSSKKSSPFMTKKTLRFLSRSTNKGKRLDLKVNILKYTSRKHYLYKERKVVRTCEYVSLRAYWAICVVLIVSKPEFNSITTNNTLNTRK